MSTGMLAERWDAYGCRARAAELATLADDLDRAYEALARAETELAGWRGPAADRALPRVRGAAVRVSRLAGRVRQAADAVRAGLRGIAEAVRLATVPAQSPRDAAEAAAVATAVDRRLATTLAEPVAVLPGPPSAALTPTEVARWWTALPPDLRRVTLAAHAAELGGLAGLPAAVRDAANRTRLAELLRLLRAERDRLAGGIGVPPELARIAVLRSRLAVAEGVERALAEHPRATLITLDLAGAGRVALGLGDVERAGHVAVLVPGMGSAAVRGVSGTVRRAERLHEQAGRESVERTAVVAWIGYAAPGLRDVPFATRARTGGRLLAADLAGLAAGRAAVGADPAHVTVVGHSYGSTVAGAALRSGAPSVRDLVVLGSPGVLADHSRDLGLPARRVYVAESPLDPVADLGAFGSDPGDRRFGAVRMRVDPGVGVVRAHSSYFDTDSEALRNVARVVVGRGTDITGESS